MTHSFDRDYWQEHWRQTREGGPVSMGSAGPSPYLATELAGLAPGTALDAGCGAGAEARWLAARCWQVTAVDISAEALAAARAAETGTPGNVRWVEADLSAWQPDEQVDLVMTHYAHPAMPQLDFYRRIAEWVAPGGTLLVVGHRHAHEPDGGHDHGHPPGQGRDRRPGQGQPGQGHPGQVGDQGHPPPEATVTAVAVAATLDQARWRVVTADERARTIVGPDGREITLDDVVLRAVRTSDVVRAPGGR